MTSQAACTALRRDFLAKKVHHPRWYTSERLQRARTPASRRSTGIIRSGRLATSDGLKVYLNGLKCNRLHLVLLQVQVPARTPSAPMDMALFWS